MNKFCLLAALAFMAWSHTGQAWAFSTETRGGQTSDGTPKFSDPDEQKPDFMINSSNGNGAINPQSSGFSHMTLPSVGDTTPGAVAFDQASAHQRDR